MLKKRYYLLTFFYFLHLPFTVTSSTSSPPEQLTSGSSLLEAKKEKKLYNSFLKDFPCGLLMSSLTPFKSNKQNVCTSFQLDHQKKWMRGEKDQHSLFWIKKWTNVCAFFLLVSLSLAWGCDNILCKTDSLFFQKSFVQKKLRKKNKRSMQKIWEKKVLKLFVDSSGKIRGWGETKVRMTLPGVSTILKKYSYKTKDKRKTGILFHWESTIKMVNNWSIFWKDNLENEKL